MELRSAHYRPGSRLGVKVGVGIGVSGLVFVSPREYDGIGCGAGYLEDGASFGGCCSPPLEVLSPLLSTSYRDCVLQIIRFFLQFSQIRSRKL